MKTKMRWILLPLVILSILRFAPAEAAVSVTLAWDRSESGATGYSEAIGYKVYWGTSSKSYQFSADAGNNTEYTISSLEEGKDYYFSATAYDSEQNESDFCPEVALIATTGAVTTPKPFTFTGQQKVAPGTTVTSNTITVSGLGAAAPISITGGEYSINGGAYTSGSGMVNNGDTVTVRQTSSGSYYATTIATLTIGGISATFSVTTTVNPSVRKSLPFLMLLLDEGDDNTVK